MSLKHYTTILGFLFCLPLGAQEISDGNFLDSINEVNNFFEKIKDPSVAYCPVQPKKATCTLSPFCKQVESNSDSAYLFKSKTGAIPNFVLKEAIAKNISQCFNQKREALQSDAEKRLADALAKADAETNAAYTEFISSEFQSLTNKSPNKNKIPKFRDEEVSKRLAEVMQLKQAGVRQQSWETLMGEKFRPADESAVRKTVEGVRETMKKWLEGKGKSYAGEGAVKDIDGLNIIVETNFDSTSGICDLSTVAYFQPDGNKMVICPRGASLPAGGLFSVVAHELGHAISPCNNLTEQTPESSSAWDKINQCLANPSTGPGPKVANWKDVRDLVQNGSDPLNKAKANQMLDSAESYKLPYACIQNGVEGYLKEFGYQAPQDQTEETQADWVSSELVQLHSQTLKKDEGSMFAMEAISPSILKHGCDLSKNKFVPKIEAAMKAAGCTENLTAKSSMMKDTNGDEHMEPERRFSLLLSTPIIYQSLGCESPKKGCK
jgi:hypothetical protein